MSEQNSFGSVDTKTPAAPVEPEEAAGRNSRALLIAGGVAAVVLAVFAYLLFGSGGDNSSDASGVVPKPVSPQPVASAPVDPATDPAAESETVPEAEDGEGRNVFLPLEVQVEAEDTTGTTTDPTAGTTTDPTTDPVVVPPPTTTPTGETVTVTLVSVKGDLVATKVGSTNYTGLSAGDTFGTNFQVYAIFNEECAGLVYGDDSFALCEGKSVKLAKL